MNAWTGREDEPIEYGPDFWTDLSRTSQAARWGFTLFLVAVTVIVVIYTGGY